MKLDEIGIHLPPGWEYWAVWISASLSTIISTVHIISHLQIYSRPTQQRLIVRIASVIPIYAITSALAFQFPDSVLYFAAVRDIAEAFVIYTFLNLLYDYLGGEGSILNAVNGVPFQGSYASCTCCLTGMPFTIATLRFCKKSTLQFCIVRPITSILEVVLYECGVYKLESAFGLHSAPLFITVIYNVSITLALLWTSNFLHDDEETAPAATAPAQVHLGKGNHPLRLLAIVAAGATRPVWLLGASWRGAGAIDRTGKRSELDSSRRRLPRSPLRRRLQFAPFK